MEQNQADPKAQKAPRLIQIMYNNRNYNEQLQAIRVSPDGVIGAVVLQSNEILVYRFMDRNNELIAEKAARKPIIVHKLNHRHLTRVIDLYIFKKPGSQNEHGVDEYSMFVLFENGVILFNGVERRTDQLVVMDSAQEGPTLLTLGCADCDYKNGILMLDAK